jgi:hypothetical protein
MLEGLLTELETLTKLSIVPGFAASGMASWLIFKHRSQLREFMMSRRRVRAKKEAEWSLIANTFTEDLHRLKTEGKIHDWAYHTLVKKMRGIGMDLSYDEPSYGKPWYFTNPLKRVDVPALKKKIKARLGLTKSKHKEVAEPKKNSLEAEFEHCRNA